MNISLRRLLLLAVLCLGLLTGCGGKPELLNGPREIRVEQLSFQLPEGISFDSGKKQLSMAGQNVGGVLIFPLPQDLTGWDWLKNLSLEEWKDDSLGYYADGVPGGQVTLEFFSDVPEGVERTVLHKHLLFFSDQLYDLWLDELLLDESTQLQLESGAVCSAPNVETQIPSNKTDYDRDVSLGLVSKQWEFLDKTWHVRIGSENVTPTGLEQTFEEAGEGHASFTAEEGFWLETFDDGFWRLLKEPFGLSYAESRRISVTWKQKDSFLIDWSDSCGALPEGFYRLGRYYTVTMEDGSTETQPCYCKFQIRNQEMDVLLKQCEEGVAQLIHSTDYYIKIWQYLRNEEFHGLIGEDRHELVDEIWRSGEDFYEEILYRYKSDGTTKATRGKLLRDGRGYEILNGKLTPANWAAGDFSSWAYYAVKFSPTDITDVWKDQVGIIHVRESTDFYDGIPFVERRYSFTEEGLFVGYQRVYFNEAGEEIVDFEMERYRTAEDETRQKIDSITVD